MSATSVPAPPRAASEQERDEPWPGTRPWHGQAGRRPALDGLRALAVLSVAVYHFGGGAGSWLPGGFLGVDVFFVLSGYLITGLLLSEYQRTGRIGLRSFWVRRARRLVPALVVVLLAVIAWIWWMAPPESYPARREDLLWTLGYLANWHLIGTADNYFAAYTAASPLRHAWSLAVEEQFYLLWPLLMLGLLRLGDRVTRRRPLAPVFVVTIVAGLTSAVLMAAAWTTISPSRAYYSTQGRVQELFAGVLLALLFAQFRGRRPRFVSWLRSPALLSQALLAAGLAAAGLLVLALFTMSDTASFYYRGGALGVSLVTAVLVGAVEQRPKSVLASVFSCRPAVALGRISYGVYLWHWPITVAIPVPTGWPAGMLFWHQAERAGLTLLLAIASFWLVERPVQRDRRVLSNRTRVLAAVVASMALVATAGVGATALPGTMAQQVTVTSDRSCRGESVDHLLACVAPEGADGVQHPPAFVLLGDSTARALGHGLDSWAASTGNTWVEAAWKRCSATGLMVTQDASAPDLPAQACSAQAPARIREILSSYRPRTVLISDFWAGSQPIWAGGKELQPGTAAHSAAIRTAFDGLVDEIASYGGRAVFMEMVPPGQSIGLSVAKGRPAATSRATVVGDGRFVDSFNTVLREVAASRPRSASTVSVTDVVCPGGICSGVEGGTVIRMDGLHYSIPFAMKLAPILLQRAGIS